jgi:hypothetical protein
MWWLLAACGSGLVVLTVVLGTLVPLQHADGVEYIFIQPGARTVAVWATGLIVLLGALYVIGKVRARAGAPARRGAARSGRWLAPLAWSGALVLGLAPAVPGAGEHAAVLGYFFYDLRWWWLALFAGTAASRFDAVADGPGSAVARRLRSMTPAARGRLAASSIFVAAVTFACAATPHLRFTGMLHGDEPRYIRYCELWYEGGGLDVSRVGLVADNPGRRPNLAGNLLHLGRALRTDARAFADDVSVAWRHPFAYRWNRATSEDAFVHGIHGGLYQIHQPGVSVVLFPGYVIDRLFLWAGAAEDGKFPAALPFTNLMMLLAFGVAGVMLFRLLHDALESDAWAAAFAAIGVLSLPAAAFAFQLYPEIPVLVVVLTVTRYLWFGTSARAATGAAMGALAGSMAWFHPRFLLLGLGFIALALVRKNGRVRIAFAAGFATLLASLMAYDYHVTGSWLPTALWDSTGEGVHFSDTSIVFNFIGYAIDRTWGVFPHAPIAIAAIAGTLVLARSSTTQALFVSGMCAALTLTAAGHTLSAAGTTPDRLIVAIVPLLMWPAAVLARATWSSRIARTLIVVLTVMTLDASVRYNLHHEKPVGPMQDASAIGWKPNLAFPVMRGDVWESSAPNFHLFVGLALALAAISFAAWWLSRTNRTEVVRGRRFVAIAGTIAVIVGALSAATSANADWTSRAYLVDRDEARRAAARRLVDIDRCRLCSSSAGGRVDWTRLRPNAATGAAMSVERDGQAAMVHVHVEGDSESLSFGRTRVDFGDGTITPWTGVVGDANFEHTYGGAETHAIVLWFQLPDGTTKVYRQ